MLSPDLFNLYGERTSRDSEDVPGLFVGGNNFNNLCYADATVLLATSMERIQGLLDKVRVYVSIQKRRSAW